MITRGNIIGKIIDDFASLQYQIDMRNKIGYYDLTKFCEDFIKDVLNQVYNLNLVNLNAIHNNNPGLDLGDEINKVAYQITSTRKSDKIIETLKSILPEQASKFSNIKIFIIGNKQKKYTIDDTLMKKFNFEPDNNVVDLKDLLKDIVVLEINELETLYEIFRREFRQFKIEFEPLDENGNYESSYLNTIEQKPANPPKNGTKLIADAKDFDHLINLYERLSKVPRITREILSIIVDRGDTDHILFSGRYHILPKVLEKIMRVSEDELLSEINILENKELISIDEGGIGNRVTQFIYISDTMLNELIYWLGQNKYPLRKFLNTMDFTLLDD